MYFGNLLANLLRVQYVCYAMQRIHVKGVVFMSDYTYNVIVRRTQQ